MKVLKFGGSSVGSAAPLLSVKKTVESSRGDLIVTVSALGGITDKLISTARMAAQGDPQYEQAWEQMRERHFALVDEVVPRGAARNSLKEELDALLSGLKNLYLGTFILKSLSDKTLFEIESYGERLSSRIVRTLIKGSVLYDPLEFIYTYKSGNKQIPDPELTGKLVRDAFAGFSGIAVVPGFIARNRDTGDIVNLGRGGSDYTASILAAELGAEILEIWTDVDGFMTADPKVIKTSYPIDELSYAEAMELCNFGASVIYAPTLYPVCAKNIPILIKNTFNPDAPGTIIQRECRHSKVITGISSIDDSCLITLSAISMVGLVGVDSRLFNALASEHISVFFVSQSSSETSITIGVGNADADKAVEVISRTFKEEIEMGAMDPIMLEKDLATVGIVGENLKNSAGLAGKVFTLLGRNGISIKALAQGASETNISFVVEKKFLRKSLNVLHDNFLLSEYQELNLFICGIGTVGGQLIQQIASQQEKLKAERSLKINIVGIARSTKGVFDRDGIELCDYRDKLKDGIDLTPSRLRDEVIGMNIFNSVFVDCTASAEIAALYGDFFDHGISVVTANKIAASSDFSNYSKLKETARRRNVKFLFETNVGAGLPIINTINALRNSGDKILRIEAVLSGTLNFIFNTISSEIPFSKTIKMAMDEGFSEPDPRIDLSGKDVIRKLVILSREAGYKVNQEDVEANLFVPQDFFECSMEEFWQKLPSLDAGFEKERQRLEKEHKCWRFVAKMEDGKYSVSLREIPEGHSFYVLDGSNNIILLTTERYNRHPMLIQGYGAGASVTAAGVFADIISIANI
ncbi:MAG: bifunctional aspartate kinase/homoserine dehydrogenase I [Bacteroidales bacterium]|nr:bifunctional aspartate kinase/homoserine dehydrogenase I [Bacteroidales bacterium]